MNNDKIIIEEHEDFLLVNGNKIYVSKILQEVILEEHKKKPESSSISQFAAISDIHGFIESVGLPDFHSGYALPIGSVAVIDATKEDASITPNGVGYDINCGVRFLKTNLVLEQLSLEMRECIGDELVQELPFDSKVARVTMTELNKMLDKGMEYLKEMGVITERDLQRTESRGSLEGDSKLITQKSKARGLTQMCTLGSGNHYLEIEVVDEIFDTEAAQILGIKKNQVVISIHTGSRGLGHGCCSEIMNEIEEYNIEKYKTENTLEGLIEEFKQISNNPNLNKHEKKQKYNEVKAKAAAKRRAAMKVSKARDDLLQVIAVKHEIGQKYLKVMSTAANFAWVNRTMIAEKTRQVLRKHFKDIEIELISDICHNIGKAEHINGKDLLVLRKGASRILPPYHKELPEEYKKIGQPILVGGSMGSSSFVITGTEKVHETFYSVCHGAGRVVPRSKAGAIFDYEEVTEDMKRQGIVFKAGSQEGMVEESAGCYKDIDAVIDHVVKIGISKKVCRVKPILVIKG